MQAEASCTASFYAKAAANFKGPIGVAIISNDGETVYAQGSVPNIGKTWKRYELTLETGAVEAIDQARLVLATKDAGGVWVFKNCLQEGTDRINFELAQILIRHSMIRAVLREVFPGIGKGGYAVSREAVA